MERKKLTQYGRAPGWGAIAVALLLLVAICGPAVATVIWSESFEAPDWVTRPTNWAYYDYNNNSTKYRIPALTTTHKHSGSSAIAINDYMNYEYCTGVKTAVSPGPSVFRAWMYDATGSGGLDAGTAVFCLVGNNTWGRVNIMEYGIHQSTSMSYYTYRLYRQSGATDSFGMTTSWNSFPAIPRTIGWHKVELYWNGQTGANAKGMYFLDGQQASAQFTLGTTATTLVQATIGVGSAGVSTPLVGVDAGCIDDMAMLSGVSKLTTGVTVGTGSVIGTVNSVATANPTWLAPTQGSAMQGYYEPSEVLTLTAVPGPGYSFAGWADGTGAIVSHSNPYPSFSISADTTLNATFTTAGSPVVLNVAPSGAGTTSGAGAYLTGDTVRASATAAAGYVFAHWSTLADGSDDVSDSNPYVHACPAGGETLYAFFVPGTYTVSVSAIPAAGGTVTPPAGGPFTPNTPVTVSAKANAGYQFAKWVDFATGNFMSFSENYGYNMPTGNQQLAAVFANVWFWEDFRNGVYAGSLDMNDPGLPGDPLAVPPIPPTPAVNAGTNGDLTSLSHWFGPNAPNGYLRGNDGYAGPASPQYGIRLMGGTKANSQDLTNVAYRCNGGNPFTGDFYLDWYFLQNTGVTGSSYKDVVSLCGYPTSMLPADKDYGDISALAAVQQFAIGASADQATGFDSGYYQYRVTGAGGYHDGWFNSTAPRSAGLHHARITVGPKKPGGTCDISFYIDNLVTPVAVVDSGAAVSINAVQFDSAGKYHVNWNEPYYEPWVEAITLGPTLGDLPKPTPGTTIATGLGALTCTWTQPSGVTGVRVYAGQSSAASSTGSATVTGLLPNTKYTPQIASYVFSGVNEWDGTPVTEPSAFTLAATPVCSVVGGVTGGVTEYNLETYMGEGMTAVRTVGGTPFAFIAVNGFANDAGAASSYKYIWNTSPNEPTSAAWASAQAWTADFLTIDASSAGIYYLHLRALNGDGVVNTTALTMGPYIAVPAGAPTALAATSGLWAKPNNALYNLTGKVVTAVLPGAFWMEEPNRSAAIKVLYTPDATAGGAVARVGDLVSVTGAALMTMGNQRVLVAGTVSDGGPAAAPIAPVTMVSRSVGGKAPNANTPSISNGIGTYNVGLLVRVCGLMTYRETIDPQNLWFDLDDGSGMMDGVNKGIRILTGTNYPPVAGFMSVTGIVGTMQSGSSVLPTVTVRDWHDWKTN